MNRFIFDISAARGLLVATPLLAASFVPALAATECAKFGKPSYEADRSVSIDGQVTRSRVYVSGDMEREEIDRGGLTEVIIIGNGQFISFLPEAKRGVRHAIGAARKPPAGSIRTREEPVAGGTRLILEARNAAGEWTIVNDVTCRSDGAVLSKVSMVPINGAMVRTSMSQSIRSSGAIGPSLFKPPADIRF